MNGDSLREHSFIKPEDCFMFQKRGNVVMMTW